MTWHLTGFCDNCERVANSKSVSLTFCCEVINAGEHAGGHFVHIPRLPSGQVFYTISSMNNSFFETDLYWFYGYFTGKLILLFLLNIFKEMLIKLSIYLHYLTNLLENEKGGTSKIGLNCQFCRKLPLFYNWVDKNNWLIQFIWSVWLFHL